MVSLVFYPCTYESQVLGFASLRLTENALVCPTENRIHSSGFGEIAAYLLPFGRLAQSAFLQIGIFSRISGSDYIHSYEFHPPPVLIIRENQKVCDTTNCVTVFLCSGSYRISRQILQYYLQILLLFAATTPSIKTFATSFSRSECRRKNERIHLMSRDTFLSPHPFFQLINVAAQRVKSPWRVMVSSGAHLNHPLVLNAPRKNNK
ncbi:hypothetical protein CEXT_33641 [Caerostris extrusa]|uniref:Uncharacterized protein n=1 Tax=Caerostris extrusa TaxID=172846 RepID=A0AAV4PS75_CAEEX|nr:hypothetical protein CEXT_33641 [Caerostris extrusa]